jgi:hypothetical protein
VLNIHLNISQTLGIGLEDLQSASHPCPAVIWVAQSTFSSRGIKHVESATVLPFQPHPCLSLYLDLLNSRVEDFRGCRECKSMQVHGESYLDSLSPSPIEPI